MKFKEAFDCVYDDMQKREKDGNKLIISPSTARILAFLWSMLAVAKNVLDDMAYIDDNNDIVSMPLRDAKKKEDVIKKETDDKEKPTKEPKGQKSESTDKKTVPKDTVDTDNEQEKQKQKE